MTLRTTLMIGLCIMAPCQPALSYERAVTVALFQSRLPVKEATVVGPVQLIAPSQRHLPGRSFVLTAAHDVELRNADASLQSPPLFHAATMVLRGDNDQTTVQLSGAPRRSYRGVLVVRAAGGRLAFSNRLPARDYIQSVVGSESLPSFLPEQLKAQSVISQTLLARYKTGDTLSDTTERQAYLGCQTVSDAVAQAVNATWGQFLAFGGRPAVVYFHSTCAGGTSDGEQYFKLKAGGFPYLKARPCKFCHESPFWKPHRSEIPKTEWQKQFHSLVPAVLEGDKQGRPLLVKTDTAVVSGYEFWMRIGQKLGWDKVPGTRYEIREAADSFVFTSTGAGHGVGFCQWGANQLAAEGKSYREILQFYFPGTIVIGFGKHP